MPLLQYALESQKFGILFQRRIVAAASATAAEVAATT